MTNRTSKKSKIDKYLDKVDIFKSSNDDGEIEIGRKPPKEKIDKYQNLDSDMDFLSNGWKEYAGSKFNVLPKHIEKIAAEKNIFKYADSYAHMIYKGDANTTTEWAIVTIDGGSYKVDAEYMLWASDPKHDIISKACWSGYGLKNAIIALCNNRLIDWRDPDYQT